MRFARPLAVLCFAAAAAHGSAQDEPADLVLHEDLEFLDVGGQALVLDLVEPPRDGTKRPVLLILYGGGWRDGDIKRVRPRLLRAARRGIVAVAAQYRLLPDHRWPAQWNDVRAAVEWLHAHGHEYDFDPERAAVLGFSAGGHLALLAGLRQAPGDRPLVRTVVNFFGVADFRAADVREGNRLLVRLMGQTFEEAPEAWAAASPVAWIQPGDPSVLSLHGTDDEVVAPTQSARLHEALKAASVPQHLEVVEGGGHGFGGDAILELVDRHLQRELTPSTFPLVASEDFEGEDFDSLRVRWTFTDEEAWAIRPATPPEGMDLSSPSSTRISGQRVLSLTRKKSTYQPPVRSPLHQALLKDSDVGSFVLDLWIQTTHPDYGHRDLCLFFGHQDPAHLYYVHLGQQADPHAHSIFLVNDAARVSIAQERTDGTPWDFHWHRVRLVRDVDSGSIEVYWDDMSTPIMKTVDKTLTHGRVGVGSFDDTGNFDAIRLWGVKAGERP